MKTALITGITGQDGLYLSEFLQEKGYGVFGTVSKGSDTNRIKLLKKLAPSARIVDMSLLSDDSIVTTLNNIRPNEIYNLASISSVARSLLEPDLTHEVNGLGPIRIINAILKLGLQDEVKMFQASSSEMFGNSLETPQSELTPLNPTSPYGASKAFAHGHCENERKKGMFIACGILFNHESPYRTEGFVSKKYAAVLQKSL